MTKNWEADPGLRQHLKWSSLRHKDLHLDYVEVLDTPLTSFYQYISQWLLFYFLATLLIIVKYMF